MDYVRAISSLLAIIQKPINVARENRDRYQELANKLEGLSNDLDIIKEGLELYDELGLVKLQDLIYDIEDFFTLENWKTGPYGFVLVAVEMDPRIKELNRIKHFTDEIRKLKEREQERSNKSKPDLQGGASSSDIASLSAAGGFTYTPEESLFGISEPKKVLLDLLQNPDASEQGGGGQDDDEQAPPKVISILGCPGVGKTALARAVYDHARASDEFDCVAWVEASGCNERTALLGKIREKVQADLPRRLNCKKRRRLNGGNAASPDLRGILADKRYLVFIDDVQQAEVCEDIEDILPKNGKSSVLIVTTRFRTVVNVCSSRPGSSYVYTMQCLPQTESEDLLWTKIYGYKTKIGPALRNGAKCIMEKCDGLPLALISVAKYLKRTKGKELDGADCVKVGEELGRHLVVGGEAEEAFRELRRALAQCYDGLPQSDYKSCMLYLSIFPGDNPIKRKSLVRKLIAEGLVSADDEECIDALISRGQKCLEGLVNRCIVEPVQNCSWSKDVKSCRVNGGIMMEFIVHKSQSMNLLTLIRKAEVVRNNKGSIRRLSVQYSAEEKFHEVERMVGLSGIRSLTMFNGNLSFPSRKTSEIFRKEDCRFLRLLDLEGCSGFNDEDLFRCICKLIYLKYLSLRNTDVKSIPQEIRKLKCLQTLDIRDTLGLETINLPEEVITLPKLAFLFGQFVLPKLSSGTNEFLKGESELQTLAGIVVEEEGFEHIILEAKNLKKVKVRCRDTGALLKPQRSNKLKLLASSVSKEIRKSPLETKMDFVSSLRSRFTSLHSVSIRSSQLSQDILASLEIGRCQISRMKLWGKLDRLPSIDTLSQLNTLSKLQLSYTGLTSDDLSILQHLPELEYLKLQENEKGSWSGSFIVRADGFESLRRLCFQASKLPKLEFETGSMRSLTSLHLLCRDISLMQVAKDISESIAHITSLNEVILHASASREIMKAWETAAKKNANRPRVHQLQN